MVDFTKADATSFAARIEGMYGCFKLLRGEVNGYRD
jgi:hypothetical protein